MIDSSYSERLVPSGGVIHLVRALEEAGVDYAPLRELLSLDFSSLTEQNSRIEAGKIPQAYALAMELQVPGDFWLRLGDSFSVHNWHLELSNWILTGKNFAEIMPKLHGLYGANARSAADTWVREEGGWIKQTISPVQRDNPSYRSDVELSAATLVRGLKSLLGERDLQFKFFFDYPQPLHGACYREVLGEQLTFDAAQTEVHIPRDYFFRTFLSSDAVMHQYYEEQLEEFFQLAEDRKSLAAQIESMLLDYHGNFPSMSQVCEALQMGERSLRRSLQEEGTTYRDILLGTKMQRAQYYLEHTDIGIEEIAYRLDYSDYANFRRAFQARFGQSPSRYRRGGN